MVNIIKRRRQITIQRYMQSTSRRHPIGIWSWPAGIGDSFRRGRAPKLFPQRRRRRRSQETDGSELLHHHRTTTSPAHLTPLHLTSPPAPRPPYPRFFHTPPSPSTRPIPPCFPVSRPGPPPRPELSGSPRSPGAMSPPTLPALTLRRARFLRYVLSRRRKSFLAQHAPPEDNSEF